jgi:5'-nucleotidase
MTTDLSNTLVIGISATSLFDMSESDQLYKESLSNNKSLAVKTYRKHMLERENDLLSPGTGFHLVEALLNLNTYDHDKNHPLVEVVIMSRNSPDTGLRVLNTIRHHKLAITRSAFTGGEAVIDYLKAFNVDLFLTTDVEDAQKVIDSKACAAALLKSPPKENPNIQNNQVRLAFDGDAVLFSEESELVYKTKGLQAFEDNENSQKNVPLPEGPYANLLKKLSSLQERLPMEIDYSPVRVAIVTARSSPADIRVIKTLRAWGVHVDEAFFMGGMSKTEVLKGFRPHIFFDDQDVHLDAAAQYVPSGRVPYPSDSPLNKNNQIKND